MHAANVSQFVQKPSEHELGLRRQALQIAIQLPVDVKDAQRVLELVQGLLGGFMTAQRPS